MSEWYYAIDGEKHGPVSKDELESLIGEGKVEGGDLAWSEGMDSWQPVHEIEELNPIPPPLPPEEKDETGPPPLPQERKSQATSSRSTSDEGSGTDDLRPQGSIEDPQSAKDTPFRSDNSSLPGGEQEQKKDNRTYGTRKDDRKELKYAGFWKRAGAVLIDSVVVGLPAGFILGMYGMDINSINATTNLIVLIYFSVMESSGYQATYGKQVIGIKVTDTDGNKIGFAKSLGRNISKILSSIILLIGWIMAGFTKRHQALHDKISGCLVVCEAKNTT